MSDKTLARRTKLAVTFDGVDISDDINRHLISLTYVDNDEDEADDLQIALEDRDEVWLLKWLNDAVEAAGSGTLKISALIMPQNWNSDGRDGILPTGEFELDDVDADGPPSTIHIKATSLPYSSTVRQTKKSKAWENYNLRGIANEIAGGNGLTCMYESGANPKYERVEQLQESDITFLQRLCKNAGISLKATNKMLVLFDEAEYEAKAAVKTIERGVGGYGKYKLRSGKADQQYRSCRVSYTDPVKGKTYSGSYTDSAIKDSGQVLEIKAKVASNGEAQSLAQKLLRQHNKFEKTGEFTLPGDPSMVAGVTVELKRWGRFDGKYIVKTAEHSVSKSGGYKTKIKLRHVLEGY
jgi:phage protein D